LAASSAVPFGTLYKIAVGETTNPGIETTRRFYSDAVRLASLLRVNASADEAAAAQSLASAQFQHPASAPQEARDAA
jgi:hypothetical protein